ncbi:uncharacterized protein LOC135943335 isoform X1 [Cloeon dipterum]|uniref:uncharacterized protein LOC135943335 isoform X1 n=2 Tax=Cloeon dipterum TaxID=197152 RepID=UPI0032209688
MLAQLCNPLMARRFKLAPFAQAADDQNKSIRRHSWSSVNVENNLEESGFLERRNQEEYDSAEDEEENRRRGPDLLQECWDVRRDDDCVSEPGVSEPLYDSIASLAMGQRASSTSSLHDPLHRARGGPTLPPSNKVSMTWALLRKPSHDLLETTPKKFVEPLMIRSQAELPRPPQLATPAAQRVIRRSRASSHNVSRSQSSTNSSSSSRNFGYDISDIDEFLSKATLQNPANIPVVLASPCVLYQPGTRRSKSGRDTWRQNESSLPLGMVVNAVFRNHNWLYVHTPHGEAGYVRYRSCLPLGILPSPCVSAPGTPAPGAWDSHSDAFPPPPPPTVPNKVRRGAASVCERRNNKTDNEKLRDTVSECGGSGGGASRSRHRSRHRTQRPEAAVDRLFLAAQRSESENTRHRRPRSSVETLLKDAELSSRRFRAESANIDSVSVKDSVSQVGVRCPKPKYPSSRKMGKLENYQYRIEQNLSQLKPNHRTIALQTDFDEVDSLVKDCVSEVGRTRSKEMGRSRGAISECGVKVKSSRAPSSAALSEVQMKTETLLLIRSDYNSRGRNTLSVSKGDVVVLVSSRLKDWFWVRRTDGCEGFIPAVVAGHGFL